MKRSAWTEADGGCLVGGGANPGGGAPKYNFAKFSKNLHEIENILGRPPPGPQMLKFHLNILPQTSNIAPYHQRIWY